MNPLFLSLTSVIPIACILLGLITLLVSMMKQDFKSLSYSFYLFLIGFIFNCFTYLILAGNMSAVYAAGTFVTTLYKTDFYTMMLVLTTLLSVTSIVGISCYYRYRYMPQIFVKSSMAFSLLCIVLFFSNVMDNSAYANGLMANNGNKKTIKHFMDADEYAQVKGTAMILK
jgi:hypothetical protein